ncbi:MAG: hypothetical protein L6U16_05505 [Porphyromonadaceae bacterium]|nr:MAG: hypothetical protein L6U16_05505 [Porphyromonadaceae bacterium]
MTIIVIFLLMGIRMAYSISMENGINRMESTTDRMQSHAPHSLYFFGLLRTRQHYICFFGHHCQHYRHHCQWRAKHNTAHTMAATRLVGGHSGAGACICCI